MWFVGACGVVQSIQPSCSSVLSPLRTLQGPQHATRFSQLELPPRDLGITWSTVAALFSQ